MIAVGAGEMEAGTVGQTVTVGRPSRPPVAGGTPAPPSLSPAPASSLSPPLYTGRTVRVALAGCGVVGSALVRLLQERAAAGRNAAPHLELVRVLVRDRARPRAVTVDPALLTADVDEFLATPADVVVEVLGGLKIPRRLAWEVLSAGRRYITGNKALIADCGPDLAEIAAHRGASLDFGAAVGGALPVVRLLRDTAAGVGIQTVRGILNGTTNYLLGRLAHGMGYEAALAEAQAHGFAETDPRRDVSGQDAADKLAVLAWLAFGSHPRRMVVRRRGLDAESTDLCAIASAVGGVVKLVAEAVQTADGLAASVEPMVVPAGSLLGSVDGEENLVEIESRSAGLMVLRGRGAGGTATASTLLADLLRGATPVHLPSVWHPSAAADPRTLRWLVLVPQEGAQVVKGFCEAGRLEYEEVLTTAKPRARSLFSVHCSAAVVDGLVERLNEHELQPTSWVRHVS